MRLTVMELKIIQTNDNGMFGGTYLNDFEYVYNNTNYRVKIEQYIKREILIGTDKVVKCSELFEMESLIEQLLFVFDGRFYPIENAAMIDENEDPSIYQNKVNHYYNNRPPIYKSIDICRHQFMKLVNFKDIDLTNTLLEWARISNELDIAFNMLLYCLSDIHMPVDCKISSMIEMTKPFGEIMEKNNDSFQIERTGDKKKLILKTALNAVIKTFGTEIFSKEIILKSTHNRRERPVHGHRGGSRGRFYYRITTFEGRPWDARDPYKTTFMALKHEIRLSIWRKQKETPGVEKAPGVSSPQRKESGRSGRDDGELRFWVRPGHPYKAVTSISQAEALAHGLTHLHHLVFAAVLARELDWCAALQDAREDARPWGVVGIGLRSDVWVEVRRDDHRPAVLVT